MTTRQKGGHRSRGAAAGIRHAIYTGPIVDIPPIDYLEDDKPKKRPITLPVVKWGKEKE